MFCYQSNFSNPTMPVDEAQFFALVRATQWNESIDKYRETGEASYKRKLPGWIFPSTFDITTSKAGKEGAWRKQSATRLTGLVVIDVDHIEDPHAVYQGWISKGLDFKDLGIYFIYITPSGKGIKLVFRARIDWGNLIDNQHAMAQVLDIEVDESGKDSSRLSYICKESDILYLDKELFTYENKEYAERYESLYRNGHSQATKKGASSDRGQVLVCDKRQGRAPVRDKEAQLADRNLSPVRPPEPMWRGYNLQSIIDARYSDKLPCKEDSNRHAESLKLATDLMLMLDGDKALVRKVVEAQPWVQEIIDERDENVEQTVESAAGCIAEKEKKYASSLPSKTMQEAVKAATGRTYQEVLKGDKEKGRPLELCSLATGGTQEGVQDNSSQAQDMDRRLEDWGERIEELFDDYPILKDVCKGLKKNQFPAALIVAGCLMMTLMTRCWYRFYHRPEEKRRLNGSAIVVGDPACGKSFATRLYKLLAAPIIEADKVGKKAINAYRELLKTKGANKEKPPKPKVIVRVHPSRTSNAQFIQDMVNAVENVDGEDMQLHMLTFDTELDNTLAVQKGGSWIDKMSMELKAFHNEEDGQAYSNVDSIFQDFNVTWNYAYTGTPLALKKKVNEQNFGSGLATRLTCIPLPETDFQMLSRESTVDFESDKRLKEWAEKLDKMKGELSVQKIVDELYDWTARRMEDAKENDSRADEMLLKRCAYHGLNFSAPFIVMRHWDKMHQEGNFYCGVFETDETDWKLAELIVNIQFACQRYFFGAMAEAYFDNKNRDASVNVHRQQKTFEAFERLPEEFTVDDVVKCFTLNNIGAARKRVCRLLKDRLIEKSGEYCENGTTKARYMKTGKVML